LQMQASWWRHRGVKREIYPRHKSSCPNAKAKHPREPRRDASDRYINARFALVIEQHQRGGQVPTVNRGVLN
jgi:hypothetical protein